MSRQFALLAAEILAIAMLRAVYVYQRDTALPRGSKARWIHGIPVVRLPFSREDRECDSQDGSATDETHDRGGVGHHD